MGGVGEDSAWKFYRSMVMIFWDGFDEWGGFGELEGSELVV